VFLKAATAIDDWSQSQRHQDQKYTQTVACMNFIMYTQRSATSKNEKIRKRRDDDQMMCFKIAIAN